MAYDKSALGNRHNCYKCEAKFYDMNGDPICPSCKADQREGDSVSPGEAFLESLSRHKRKSSKSEEEATAQTEAEDTGLSAETDADDIEDDDDEDELLASLSGEVEEEEEEL